MLYVIYGDEAELIKENERSLLAKYPQAMPLTLDEEAGAQRIGSEIFERSLFAEPRVYILRNVPILKKTKVGANGSGKASTSLGVWQPIYDGLLSYDGENPIILVYDGNLDLRVKHNKALLAKAEVFRCAKLSDDEIKQWAERYIRSKGCRFSEDGRLYFFDMIDIWQEVPLHFLKTEFDRFFLLLPEKEPITANFMMEHGSDFGVKNIFLFKDALLHKKVHVLRELLPHILSTKEQERSFAYIESQLRLQLMVAECRQRGMSLQQVKDFLHQRGSKVKDYPIKLAYEESRNVSVVALREFLYGMYELVLNSRRGVGKVDRFQDLCLQYCIREG